MCTKVLLHGANVCPYIEQVGDGGVVSWDKMTQEAQTTIKCGLRVLG